jgi:hypothetical protein
VSALCGAGADERLAKCFPDLRCDREAGHAGPHRERGRNGYPGREDWWLDGAIAISEELILEMMRDRAREEAQRFTKEMREARRRAKPPKPAKVPPPESGDLFGGGGR